MDAALVLVINPPHPTPSLQLCYLGELGLGIEMGTLEDQQVSSTFGTFLWLLNYQSCKLSFCGGCVFQDEDVPLVSFWRILNLNLSEWPYLLVGVLCAVINGCIQPVFAIVFSRIVGVSASVCSVFVFTEKEQINCFCQCH